MNEYKQLLASIAQEVLQVRPCSIAMPTPLGDGVYYLQYSIQSPYPAYIEFYLDTKTAEIEFRMDNMLRHVDVLLADPQAIPKLREVYLKYTFQLPTRKQSHEKVHHSV